MEMIKQYQNDILFQRAFNLKCRTEVLEDLYNTLKTFNSKVSTKNKVKIKNFQTNEGYCIYINKNADTDMIQLLNSYLETVPSIVNNNCYPSMPGKKHFKFYKHNKCYLLTRAYTHYSTLIDESMIYGINNDFSRDEIYLNELSEALDMYIDYLSQPLGISI